MLIIGKSIKIRLRVMGYELRVRAMNSIPIMFRNIS